MIRGNDVILNGMEMTFVDEDYYHTENHHA